MENGKKEMIERIGDMFFQYGIRNISMDDISRELGISKKTLYQKFRDKKDIVEQFMRLHMEEMSDFLENKVPLKEDAIVEILELLKAIREVINKRNPSYEYDLKKYYTDLYREHEQYKINSIKNFYTRNYKRGIKEGYYRDDFNIDMMVKFHLTYNVGIEKAGFFTKEELLNFDYCRQYFIYHIRGIANEKGIEILNNNLENYNF